MIESTFHEQHLFDIKMHMEQFSSAVPSSFHSAHESLKILRNETWNAKIKNWKSVGSDIWLTPNLLSQVSYDT